MLANVKNLMICSWCFEVLIHLKYPEAWLRDPWTHPLTAVSTCQVIGSHHSSFGIASKALEAWAICSHFLHVLWCLGMYHQTCSLWSDVFFNLHLFHLLRNVLVFLRKIHVTLDTVSGNHPTLLISSRGYGTERFTFRAQKKDCYGTMPGFTQQQFYHVFIMEPPWKTLARRSLNRTAIGFRLSQVKSIAPNLTEFTMSILHWYFAVFQTCSCSLWVSTVV